MCAKWSASFVFLQVLSFLLFLHKHYYVSSHMLGNNPYHRLETLDSQGKYRLEWIADWTTKRVTFNVTVKTRGYVGFGLSSEGKMQGADIVIGGVKPTGQVYFSDRHAVGHHLPEVDPSQDWVLHAAWENKSHTFLSFSRDFDTCDDQDYPITDNRITLIWAFGEKDDESEYHFKNKGIFELYLVLPDYTPPVIRDESGRVIRVLGNDNLTDLKTWTKATKMIIPSDHTTYWCTVHAPPQLDGKHHIVGMEVRFGSAESRRHVHHFATHRCYPPPGESNREIFEPFLNHEGQQCFMLPRPQGPIPTQYCTEFLWPWGVGGRIVFFPPHVGIPFGETPDEFFLIQLHYDNPNRLPNVEVEASVDFFYTKNLRPNDMGLLVIRTPSPGLPLSILLPPSSIDHHTYAHCSPECTRQMIPEGGIDIAMSFIHAHYSGRAVRIQHFRGDQELPWIYGDDNFGINFQQIVSIHKDIKVLPGDQLIVRCTYDTTWINGSVVGGYSTRQEMCVGYGMYYTKLRDHGQCISEIESEHFRNYFLGVTNVTWSAPHLEYVVNPPHPLAGKTIKDISDNHVLWTLKRRDELRKFHLVHPQINTCPRFRPSSSTAEGVGTGGFVNEGDVPGLVSYPIYAKAYKPEDFCSKERIIPG